LVDNNLKQKKKQPKVVREKGLTVETSEDFFHENYYRDLCGTGGPLVFPRGPKDHTLKCRLIHHHDPYLSKKLIKGAMSFSQTMGSQMQFSHQYFPDC